MLAPRLHLRLGARVTLLETRPLSVEKRFGGWRTRVRANVPISNEGIPSTRFFCIGGKYARPSRVSFKKP